VKIELDRRFNILMMKEYKKIGSRIGKKGQLKEEYHLTKDQKRRLKKRLPPGVELVE